MNRFSRIRHHVDMKDVKKRHLEETAAKKLEEKRLKEEAEQIRAEYEKWKVDWRDELKLDEGMTTSGLYKVVLPAAGDTDLETVNLGVSGGHAPVNYGNSISNTEEDPNTIPDGTEYTALTNLEPLTTVEKGGVQDTNSAQYWLVRTFDQATQSWDGHVNGGDSGFFSSLVPGFKNHTMRNVQLSGAHSTREIDHPTNPGGYHPTSNFGSRDEIGQPFTSSSNRNIGAGVVLSFKGPGSPRFAALRPVDATEIDTIKVHALVADTNLVADGQHSSIDCRPQIYYWAGNHPDFKASFLNGSLFKFNNQNVTVDGWRPINMKPNGDIDSSVDPFIIKYREDEDASGNKNRAGGYTPARYNEATDSMDPPIYSAGHLRVYPYSLKLPEWTQTKGARFMIIQHFLSFSPGGSSFHVSGVRYQRKNAMTSFARLDDPKASSFIRVGQGVGNQSAEQRRKRVRDMIKASVKYGQTKFGDGVVTSTNID